MLLQLCNIFVIAYLQNIIYIHGISRNIAELLSQKLQGCQFVQRNGRILDNYLRATTLYVAIERIAHSRLLHIICIRIESCDISSSRQKEKKKGMKFPRTLTLKLIKCHIQNVAVAIGMHLTRKEANRFATRFFFYCRKPVPIFYTRFR